MQMSIYFQESATPENVENVQKYLVDQNKFAGAKFVSKAEALQSFQEQMASYAPDMLKDPELVKFIPSSLQVAVQKTLPVNEHLPLLETTAKTLKVWPGVEDVTFGQEWVKNFASVFEVVQWAGLTFIGILLASSLFVMLNSISTSIYQRKFEIEVLELIGATASFIRTPFVFEGAMLGGVCALISVSLTASVTMILKNYLHAQASFVQVSEHLESMTFMASLVFVIAGTFMGAFSAWLCVRRINTGWAASGGSN